MTIKKKGHRQFVYLVAQCYFINWIDHIRQNICELYESRAKENRHLFLPKENLLDGTLFGTATPCTFFFSTLCCSTVSHTHYVEMANSKGLMFLFNEQMWKTTDQKCAPKNMDEANLISFDFDVLFLFLLCLELLYSLLHTFSHVLQQFNGFTCYLCRTIYK